MPQVPGLNAPIPPGASFGYQPGGWGKPPVNEDGIPLYGDVFAEHQLEDDDENVRFPSCAQFFCSSPLVKWMCAQQEWNEWTDLKVTCLVGILSRLRGVGSEGCPDLRLCMQSAQSARAAAQAVDAL